MSKITWHHDPVMANPGEWSAHYRDTWIGFKDTPKSEILPVFITGATKEPDLDISLIGSLFKYPAVLPEKRYLSVQKQADKLVLTPPTLGYINLPSGYSVYFAKAPLRQWKRGYQINIESVSICNPALISNFSKRFLELQRKLSTGPWPLINDYSTHCVYNLYNPSYVKSEEAIKRVLEGRNISCAISRNFSIGLLVGSESPVMFYKGKLVGIINKDNSVKLFNNLSHLTEELSQYINVSGTLLRYTK